MTKLRLLPMAIFAILACCVIACSDDDKKEKDDDPTEGSLETQIAGKWVVYDDYIEWGYQFNRNKTGIEFEGNDSWPITWRVSGKKVTTTDPSDGDTDNFIVTYIDDDCMYVNFEGFDEKENPVRFDRW